jgi:hypothetical protein
MADCGLLRVLLIFAIIVNDCCKSEKYYNREQETGEQETGEQGTGNRLQGRVKSEKILNLKL